MVYKSIREVMAAQSDLVRRADFAFETTMSGHPYMSV